MLLIAFCAIVFLTPEARADDSFLQNLRRTIDLSSRIISSDEDNWHLAAIGLDTHTVISGVNGDIGTLTFQPYFLRIDGAQSPPQAFDDNGEWKLRWRITNFNFTGLAHGRLNIRVGHFELPFGLEQIEQTNGTLYQMNSQTALGLKADWGTSINGTLPGFEYEMAYTLGTGNDIGTSNGGIISGRIGSPPVSRYRLGVSFLNGKQHGRSIIERKRYGMDVSVAVLPGLDLAWEIARGSDDGMSVTHQLGQALWTDKYENWTAFLQFRKSRQHEIDTVRTTSNATLGARFEPNRHWSFSAQWERPIESLDAIDGGNKFTAQVRYRL